MSNFTQEEQLTFDSFVGAVVILVIKIVAFGGALFLILFSLIFNLTPKTYFDLMTGKAVLLTMRESDENDPNGVTIGPHETRDLLVTKDGLATMTPEPNPTVETVKIIPVNVRPGYETELTFDEDGNIIEVGEPVEMPILAYACHMEPVKDSQECAVIRANSIGIGIELGFMPSNLLITSGYRLHFITSLKETGGAISSVWSVEGNDSWIEISTDDPTTWLYLEKIK